MFVSPSSIFALGRPFPLRYSTLGSFKVRQSRFGFWCSFPEDDSLGFNSSCLGVLSRSGIHHEISRAGMISLFNQRHYTSSLLNSILYFSTCQLGSCKPTELKGGVLWGKLVDSTKRWSMKIFRATELWENSVNKSLARNKFRAHKSHRNRLWPPTGR